MRRSRWLVVVLILALAAFGVAGALVAHARHHRLTYSVTGSKGDVGILVADERDGQHTSWFILQKMPSGKPRVIFRSYTTGRQGSEHHTVSAQPQVPAGTYRWAIYSVDGPYHPQSPKYWTPEHLLAKGQVMVR